MKRNVFLIHTKKLDDNDEFNEQLEEWKYNIKAMTKFNYVDFHSIEETVDKLKKIDFEDTSIIIGEDLVSDFFQSMNENYKNFKVVLKILILGKDKKEILKNNKTFPFFNENYIYSTFEEIKNKLDLEFQPKRNVFLFDYFDNYGQLEYQIKIKTIVDNKPTSFEINKLINYIYNINEKDKDKENNEIKEIMNQLYENNVPLKIIVKYMLKLASFDKIINLINEKLISYIGNTYDNYIKLLYYGLTKFQFNSFVKEKLYLGTTSKKREIEHGKNFLKNSKCYCYNNGYLFFTLDENEAKQSMNNKVLKDSEDEVKVLFEIESGNDLDLKYASNVEFKEYSNSKQKEILFFPYSSFEILKIDEIDGYYKIVLGYIGKYKEKAEKENKNNKGNIIPTRFLQEVLNEKKLVSEKQVEVFKKELPQLIEGTKENKKANEERKKEIEKMNKTTTEKRKKEKKRDEFSASDTKIKETDPFLLDSKNTIIGEFEINKEQVGQSLNLINPNKIHIEDYVEILEDSGQKLSITEKFKKNKKYKITYNFSENFNDFTYLFQSIEIKSLDLSKLKMGNITSVESMFSECKNLTSIDLSNKKLKKLEDLSRMFFNCFSLESVNLENFTSKKIKEMDYMFYKCKSLKHLNLKNLNTEGASINNIFFGVNKECKIEVENDEIKNEFNKIKNK